MSSQPARNQARHVHALLLGAACVVLVWSGIDPRDRFTWWLEVMPVLLGVPVLLATYRRFPFSTLIYALMAAHAAILMVGGHYTYAEVPLFDWIRDALGTGRNDYDKVGHFAQGFVPALVAREILLRTSPLGGSRRWLFVLCASVSLSISALYELLEWGVAVATGTAAEAFLGTQGYVWDTQSDMAWALVGALTSLSLLGGLHDRSMAAGPLKAGSPEPER